MAKPMFETGTSLSGNTFLYKLLINDGVEVTGWNFRDLCFGRVKILHVHWPDNVLKPKNSFVVFLKLLSVILLFQFVRMIGIKIVWTAHNLRSHEQNHPWLESIFWFLFPRLIDGVAYPSVTSQRIAHRRSGFNKIRNNKIARLGNYLPMITKQFNKLDERASLGISQDCIVLISVGAVRDYKSIDKLATVWKSANPDPNKYKLIIAGQCNSDLIRDKLVDCQNQCESILLDLRRLPDEDFIRYHAVSDCTALTYDRITNSGAALFSLSMGIPIISSPSAIFREISEQVGPGWVTPTKRPLTKEGLWSAIEKSANTPRTRIRWGGWNWTEHALQVKSLYAEIVR